MMAGISQRGAAVAVSQEDIDALNKAIASGVRSVTIGETTTIYNTTESLIKARNDMVTQLAAQEAVAAGKVQPRQMYTVYAGRDYD